MALIIFDKKHKKLTSQHLISYNKQFPSINCHREFGHLRRRKGENAIWRANTVKRRKNAKHLVARVLWQRTLNNLKTLKTNFKVRKIWEIII